MPNTVANVVTKTDTYATIDDVWTVALIEQYDIVNTE